MPVRGRSPDGRRPRLRDLPGAYEPYAPGPASDDLPRVLPRAATRALRRRRATRVSLLLADLAEGLLRTGQSSLRWPSCFDFRKSGHGAIELLVPCRVTHNVCCASATRESSV